MLNIATLLGDAFSALSLTTALDEVQYQPNYLDSLGIFQDVPISGEFVAIEKRGATLRLVPTSSRGAPVPQRVQDPRSVRAFKTPRVANGDRVNASELLGVRAFGSDNELEPVAAEILRRGDQLRADNNLTQEHMRLGAIQGIVVDSDGTTEIVNWFDEWDITPPAEIDFNLDAVINGKKDAGGAIRGLLSGVARTMRQNSGGLWSPGARVMALAGDNFYDQLIQNKEVRETYLNQQEASSLRDAAPVYESFTYGGVTFVNYQGTDDNSTVAIDPDKAKFFPAGVRGVFQRALSPGESLDLVNTLGKPFYFWQIPDKDRNMWVDLEVYSYPLYICTRPQMLLTGKAT